MNVEHIEETTITELPAEPRETLRQRVFRLDTSQCEGAAPQPADTRLRDLLARRVELEIAARG